jgi:hypothetical protein
MPTPPDQNIPPLRKVKPLRVTLAVPLTAHVPGVCDIGGLVLQRLGDARLAELMAEMNRTSDHWYRARVLFGGEAEQFWWKRFGEAAQRANIDNLNHFTKALDVLGAGATAVGAYARSAKDSMVGRFWDAAAGGVVDYAMGSSGLAIGPQFTGLEGGAAVAAADTVVELAIPGGGLSSLFMGTLQAARSWRPTPRGFTRNHRKVPTDCTCAWPARRETTSKAILEAMPVSRRPPSRASTECSVPIVASAV